MNLYLALQQDHDTLTRGERLMARSGDPRDFVGAVALVAARLDVATSDAWIMVEAAVR
jgi:hypothetical protein